MPVIKKFQTLLDFATQYTGNAEGIFDVADLNDIGITDEVAPGTPLKILQNDPQVTRYFDASKLDIASGFIFLDEDHRLEGIDYWVIEEDFIVQ